jgi:hypothetical protein
MMKRLSRQTLKSITRMTRKMTSLTRLWREKMIITRRLQQRKCM